MKKNIYIKPVCRTFHISAEIVYLTGSGVAGYNMLGDEEEYVKEQKSWEYSAGKGVMDETNLW